MKPIVGIFACAAMLTLAAGAQMRRCVRFRRLILRRGPVKITPVYHASLEIEAGGKVIIIDPAKPANFAGLPQADLILVTDIHGDHLDEALLAAESKAGTEVIAPDAVAKMVKTAKITKVLANGENTTWGDWKIEAIPMYNTTASARSCPRQVLSR